MRRHIFENFIEAQSPENFRNTLHWLLLFAISSVVWSNILPVVMIGGGLSSTLLGTAPQTRQQLIPHISQQYLLSPHSTSQYLPTCHSNSRHTSHKLIPLFTSPHLIIPHLTPSFQTSYNSPLNLYSLAMMALLTFCEVHSSLLTWHLMLAKSRVGACVWTPAEFKLPKQLMSIWWLNYMNLYSHNPQPQKQTNLVAVLSLLKALSKSYSTPVTTFCPMHPALASWLFCNFFCGSSHTEGIFMVWPYKCLYV